MVVPRGVSRVVCSIAPRSVRFNKIETLSTIQTLARAEWEGFGSRGCILRGL